MVISCYYLAMVLLQQINSLQSISRYCNSGTYSKQTNKFRYGTVYYVDVLTNCRSSKPKPSKEKAKQRLKDRHKHSESRRRSRIRDHLSNLRAILSSRLVKKNQASVLGEAIQRINELNGVVSELKSTWTGDGNVSISGTWEHTFPSDEDYIRVEYCSREQQRGGRGLVEVKFSCKEKKMLMTDVLKAVSAMNGEVVRTGMVYIGGRIECELWVLGTTGRERLGIQKNALNAITSKSRS